MLRHEIAARGSLKPLEEARIVICGAGALGSNLAFNLLKQGLKDLVVVDHDRVEDHNIGTQMYGPPDAGDLKVDALERIVYQASGESIQGLRLKLESKNIKKIGKPHLIVDGLDNSAGRQVIYDYARSENLPCIHAGFNGQYAEIKWNEAYIVPSDQGEDICEYPLARNLVILTVSVLAEVVVRFLLAGERLNRSITFQDLKIHQN